MGRGGIKMVIKDKRSSGGMRKININLGHTGPMLRKEKDNVRPSVKIK